MSNGTIILSIVLLVFLVLQAYVAAMKKKRDKEAAGKYQILETSLEEKSKEGGRRFDDSFLFVNDQEQGVRLCFDEKGKILALVMENDYREIPYASVQSYDVYAPEDHGLVQSVAVRIETKEQTLDYSFGSKPRRKGSPMEKLVRNSAGQMLAALRAKLNSQAL